MHGHASATACRQQGRLTVTTVTTSRQVRAANALIAEYVDWIERGAPDYRGGVIGTPTDPVTSFARPPGALLLARDGSSTVGVASVHHHDGATVELRRMYVRPWARRLGVGDALLSGALLAARRLGATRIVLEAHADHMPEALRLYRRAGFVEAAPLRTTSDPRVLTLQRSV